MRHALLLLLAASGCGGASAGSTAPAPARPGSNAPASAQVGSGISPQDAVQTCFQSTPRGDYSFVASYRCSDGSMPLGGDLDRGAQARLGNVGEGPDGHILDLYEVPCGSGPVRLYVDMYHCGPGADVEIDPANLTRAQLVAIASAIRQLHAVPTEPRALAMRRDLIMLITQTQQFTVTICTSIAGALPSREDGPPYAVEFMLSLAAAVIEDGRPQIDPVAVHVAAFRGLLAYYRALQAADPSLHEPELDALAAQETNGTLTANVAQAVASCDLSGMGVHFAR